MEIKKGIKRVNIKVDKVKTKVTKIKTEVTKIKTKCWYALTTYRIHISQ